MILYGKLLLPSNPQAKLQEVIEEEERAGRSVARGEGGAAAEAAKIPSLSQRFDIDDSDIIITGTTNTRISRQQVRPLCRKETERERVVCTVEIWRLE